MLARIPYRRPLFKLMDWQFLGARNLVTTSCLFSRFITAKRSKHQKMISFIFLQFRSDESDHYLTPVLLVIKAAAQASLANKSNRAAIFTTDNSCAAKCLLSVQQVPTKKYFNIHLDLKQLIVTATLCLLSCYFVLIQKFIMLL